MKEGKWHAEFEEPVEGGEGVEWEHIEAVLEAVV